MKHHCAIAEAGRRKRGKRNRRARTTRGAAAVELALVSLILFPILFGIIDYGLWFNDSLNTRQGVREGARRAVVENVTVPAGSPCTSMTDATRMACITKELIGPAAGTAYVRIVAPSGWARGNPLVVCGMTKVDGVTGITPLPSSGLVRSKTQMSIEAETTPINGGSPVTVTTGTPSNGSWGWCA
jgi:Flp pilus assembly protein TadG